MTFKEFLSEANKYSFGSWKSVIKLIITDFMNQPDEKLKKMLGKMQLHELKNTVRNATAYIEHVELDKQEKKFLDKLIQFAKDQVDETIKHSTSNTFSEVTEKDWEQLEKLVQSQDPDYQKSEDPKVIQKGNKISDSIQKLYKVLVKVDQKRANKIMKK